MLKYYSIYCSSRIVKICTRKICICNVHAYAFMLKGLLTGEVWSKKPASSKAPRYRMKRLLNRSYWCTVYLYHTLILLYYNNVVKCLIVRCLRTKPATEELGQIYRSLKHKSKTQVSNYLPTTFVYHMVIPSEFRARNRDKLESDQVRKWKQFEKF